jgi:hypothetical protein
VASRKPLNCVDVRRLAEYIFAFKLLLMVCHGMWADDTLDLS